VGSRYVGAVTEDGDLRAAMGERAASQRNNLQWERNGRELAEIFEQIRGEKSRIGGADAETGTMNRATFPIIMRMRTLQRDTGQACGGFPFGRRRRIRSGLASGAPQWFNRLIDGLQFRRCSDGLSDLLTFLLAPGGWTWAAALVAGSAATRSSDSSLRASTQLQRCFAWRASSELLRRSLQGKRIACHFAMGYLIPVSDITVFSTFHVAVPTTGRR